MEPAEAAAAIQQLQNQLADLQLFQQQQHQQHQQQVQQQLQRPSNLVKLQSFDGKTPRYLEWERHLFAVALANNWQLDTTIRCAVAAMRGTASDMAQNLPLNAAQYGNDMVEFRQQLRSLFLSPAFRQNAMMSFDMRVQGKDEPLRVYWGALLDLYKEGHCFTDEAWREDPNAQPVAPYNAHAQPPGSRAPRLITAFIQGIYNPRLRLQVRNHVDGHLGHQVVEYLEVQRVAVAFESNQARNECDTKRVKDAPQFYRHLERDGLQRPAQNTAARRNEEPMELGALAQTPGWAQKKCQLHPEAGHLNGECRVQRGQKLQGRQEGQMPRAGPPQRLRGAQAKAKIKRDEAVCSNCRGVGHFAKECPSAKKAPKGAGGKPLNALDDPEEAEVAGEDEEGWEEEEDPDYDLGDEEYVVDEEDDDQGNE